MSSCFQLFFTKYLAGLCPGMQRERIKEAFVITAFSSGSCHLSPDFSMFLGEGTTQTVIIICNRKTEGTIFSGIYGMGLCVPQEIRIGMPTENSNGRTRTGGR